jgi:formate dehydrogenase iron-sulfur subunit
MSDGKSILVDTTRCTACRGCQVACKQWNGLPGTKTKQVGTYQNPQELSAATWKLVRFSEGRQEDGKPYWYFFSEQCRHCVDPPCLEKAGEPTAIYQDKATGAVIYTKVTKKLDTDAIVESCPYNVPRKGPDGALNKCTMCFDRQQANMIPACVQSCPTGAMLFGERSAILSEAKARVAALKTVYPKAQAIDADSVRVVFIVADEPHKYYEYAAG